MSTLWRNLVSVLRRFKLAAALNLFGLSVAFTAFMVIMMQWSYDQHFDREQKDGDRIFRVEMVNNGAAQAIVCRPLMDELAQSSPHILKMTLKGSFYFCFFQVGEGNTAKSFQETFSSAYPNFADFFQFEMLEGERNAMEAPEKVLIPEHIARKLFGNEPAVGKLLRTSYNNFTVGGVYRDFPDNASVRNAIYYSMGDENLHNGGNWNYSAFVLMDDAANMQPVLDAFQEKMRKEGWGENLFAEGSGISLRAVPFHELHFLDHVAYDPIPKSSRQTLLVLFAIAIIIVLIAGINFTNFSTALTPMRIKSINTQKVLGEKDAAIRSALVAEAVGISLLAYLVSLFLLFLLKDTPVATLVDADLSLTAHPLLLGLTGIMALAVGVLAGLYPAFYATSFPPALVLKGSFGLSPKGRQLRNGLIGIQFIASFALAIASSFMFLQNYYMHHAPLGFNKEELIVCNMSERMLKNYEMFANRLKRYAGISDVTFSQFLLNSSDQYMGWGRQYRNEDIQFQCLPVHPSFLKVLGIPVEEGRDFRPDDVRTRYGAYIFNQSAKAAYDMKVGEAIDSATIVGFIPNVKFASFRSEVTPMAFYIWGTAAGGDFYPLWAYIQVKPGADLRAAMEEVRKAFREFDSDYPIDARFFDEVLNAAYEKEHSLAMLITLFSLVAIFISIVGVFGLVVFDSEYRRKEIGVRKVLGSTTAQILLLFNKTYVKILTVCFVVAAPLAWYGVQEWLKNFAYRTPMYLWVYVAAFGVVALVTVATVTFQNWRAANANPVDSIKNE